MTDLDDTLTAVFGGDLDDATVAALAGYVDVGGILVFNTGAPFGWCYARVLRPLTAALVARRGSAGLLARVPLTLSGGNEIFLFDLGGYRLALRGEGRDKGDGLDDLVRLSGGRGAVLDPALRVFPGDSFGPGGIDRPVAGKIAVVVNGREGARRRASAGAYLAGSTGPLSVRGAIGACACPRKRGCPPGRRGAGWSRP